jgi:hypothetical protein
LRLSIDLGDADELGANSLLVPAVLALTTAVGLLIVASADYIARQSSPIATLVLWAGLLIMIVPVAIRLFGIKVSRGERVGLLVLIGVALYLVKLAQYPIRFSYFDEFLHLRTLQDILSSGHLFMPNSMLPVSPYYPGLESATSSLVLIGGFSHFEAGIIVTLTARVILLLGLFLFYESVSGSPRLAALGALVYTVNPNFMFFSAQFAYETLALPFAIMTIYAVQRRSRAIDRPYVGWVLILIFGAATVVTHHISSLALTAFLAVWTVIHLVGRLRSGGTAHTLAGADVVNRLRAASFRTVSPAKPAIAIGLMAAAWLFLVATVTVGYLAPAIQGAAAEVIRLALGESEARQLFRGAGVGPPLWEVAAGYLSVICIIVALPFGLYELFTKARLNSALLALMLVSQAYPVAQVARFTERGAEISARTATFVFVGVGFVVAAAFVSSRPWRLPSVLPRAIPIAVLVAMFVGGVVVGVPVWSRLPGPYLVGADARSIERESVAAASWTHDYLGGGNRFLADRSNRLVLLTFGQQHIITGAADRLNLRPLFFATSYGEEEERIAGVADVQYVLVDRRLSSSLPLVGVYTERGEALGGRLTEPIPAAALEKYDAAPGVSRIYDSGNIQVYELAGR